MTPPQTTSPPDDGPHGGTYDDTYDGGTYDEALARLHRTGPEFEGYLSNHGPMVVELLARRGHGDAVHRWTEDYLDRLDELPAPRWAIGEDWRGALGDVGRAGDWIEHLHHELVEHPWPDVLATWWPRLLPGIAAGATHGVIRVGHAVRALRVAETEPRLTELAHALGYWAARWTPLPLVRPAGGASSASLLGGVPRVAVQDGGVGPRLAQLADTPGWSEHACRLAGPQRAEDVPAALDALVDATVTAYPGWAHGQPTMLVHAATAPNAVAAALPALPPELWVDSFAAVWSASAAVVAAYRPAQVRPGRPAPVTVDDALDAALRHGGEHVLKLTDTALRSHARTGDPRALAAVSTAVALDA